jgi:hypothetical protein
MAEDEWTRRINEKSKAYSHGLMKLPYYGPEQQDYTNASNLFGNSSTSPGSGGGQAVAGAQLSSTGVLVVAVVVLGMIGAVIGYSVYDNMQQKAAAAAANAASLEAFKVETARLQTLTFANAKSNHDVSFLCNKLATEKFGHRVSLAISSFHDKCRCEHKIGNEIDAWCRRYVLR